ncbi:protein SIEVE ELEMENT OCCLUSION B-like [Humulus lupulus]|uniref:protein SIEVE ELEMENT OCCLUSION B-like n=1 Tax=Humulus lupulus TaxID=3486 RepID=UPI002B413267|nr:protein SIEVE ELEMENT OCCLUSION B-like [Humulus lupulus]
MLKKFWSNVESLLGSRTSVEVDQKAPEKDDYFGAKDIAKLLSFNYKDGWVLFSKGPSLVTIGYIPTMCKVLEEFGKWKENIQKNGFEKSLKDYYETLSGTTEPTCCHFYIPTHEGKNLEIQCPDPGCSRTLEMFTSYKCCHVDPPLNAFH